MLLHYMHYKNKLLKLLPLVCISYHTVYINTSCPVLYLELDYWCHCQVEIQMFIAGGERLQLAFLN